MPPLLLLGALVLDLLAIHPFEEGNGRVARLLTTSELLRHGYGVARYVLEQAPRRFRFAQIVDALPDISDATIRAVLDELRKEGHLTATRGRKAIWERTSS